MAKQKNSYVLLSVVTSFPKGQGNVVAVGI